MVYRGVFRPQRVHSPPPAGKKIPEYARISKLLFDIPNKVFIMKRSPHSFVNSD